MRIGPYKRRRSRARTPTQMFQVAVFATRASGMAALTVDEFTQTPSRQGKSNSHEIMGGARNLGFRDISVKCQSKSMHGQCLISVNPADLVLYIVDCNAFIRPDGVSRS